jgi:hypothetical protein
MSACFFCVSEGLGDLAVETTMACRMCGNSYCETHASKAEPTFCESCTATPKLEITEKPLIDEDGVLHNGREISIKGETWFSQCRIISELSEVELPKWVDKYRMMLHDAERAKEYRQIMLSALELEQADRAHTKARALRYVKVPTTAAKQAAAKPRRDKIQSVVELLKSAGLTPADLQALISAKVQQK